MEKLFFEKIYKIKSLGKEIRLENQKQYIGLFAPTLLSFALIKKQMIPYKKLQNLYQAGKQEKTEKRMFHTLENIGKWVIKKKTQSKMAS